MKEKIKKLRNDVLTSVTNQSDELTICLLRVIELLEEKNGRAKPGRKPGAKPGPKPKLKRK